MPVLSAIPDEIWDQMLGTWRFRWAALALAVGIAVSGWLFVFTLKDSYEADASVFVDTRTPLKPALQGLTVEQDVNAELNYVRQSLLADPQLQHIAEEAGVLPTRLGAERRERLLDAIRKRILFTVRGAGEGNEDRSTSGTIYSISFQDASQARALRLVQILLDTLVNQTLGSKREGSENAQQFLTTQIKDYEQRLRSAEDRLAEFKSKHLGVMPSEQGGYFNQLQKENDAIEEVRTKLRTAESRRATLQQQLHGDAALSAPSSAVVQGKSGTSPTDTLSRIAETQAHLDELLLRFTEKHPDVVATREALADLKRRRAAELDSLRRGDLNAAAASGIAANPVYQSIQLALNQTEVDISDLRTELFDHEGKAAELRRLLNTAPQVEAEYAQLTRDYDVNKAQYTALLANFEKARLGERADIAGSVRFEVVQPPAVSAAPVAPRRTLLLTGILVVAVAAGAALGYGLNTLQPLAASASMLAQQAGVAVLGVVGTAFPELRGRERRESLRRFSFAALGLVLAFGAVLILNHAGLRLNLPMRVGTL